MDETSLRYLLSLWRALDCFSDEDADEEPAPLRALFEAKCKEHKLDAETVKTLFVELDCYGFLKK